MENPKISILGSGVVGQAVGKVFAKHGFEVIFFDIDQKRLKSLKKYGKTTTDLESAILNSDLSFICLPTPTINNRFDGSLVESILEKAIKFLKKKKSYHLLVIKSTVMVGFTEKIINRFSKVGKKILGKDYGICANPEFLRSESPEEDFEGEECPVIIGASDPLAGKNLKKVYQTLGKRAAKNYQILVTNPRTAEMIKYASNCLLATKISFFNQLKNTCQRLKIRPKTITKFALDKKTDYWYRPNFLKLGFQDECLPKDLSAFLTFITNDLSSSAEILAATKKINEKIVSQTKKARS